MANRFQSFVPLFRPVLERCAFSTAAHIVASHAACKTNDANASQWEDGTGLYATGRAEQNVLRTLKKLAAAGIVRLDRGEGRARRPVLAARKVHFEIDLLAAP